MKNSTRTGSGEITTASQFAEELEFRCPAPKGGLILDDLRYR